MKKNNQIITWLFRPFVFIAGSKALVIGLIIMTLISIVGYLGQTHFDGVLDIHIGCLDTPKPYVLHAFYQLSTWIILTIVFYITARIITKSHIRFIDIAGTMAFAQAPLIFAALFGLIPSFHICMGDLHTINLDAMINIMQKNMLMLVIGGIVMAAFGIWTLILRYNAYTISANVKGAPAIISFIVALLISEIISKTFIYIFFGFSF